MRQSETARKEVNVFEKNAVEGVRLIAFLWFFRRIAIPLAFIIMVVVVGAFIANGPIAGLLSALIFGGPFILLWRFTVRQSIKVTSFVGQRSE